VLGPGEGLQLLVEGGPEALGYAERGTDPADGRCKIIRLTPRGLDSLARSAAIFEDLRARWVTTIGARRLAAMEADLRTMTPAGGFRLDVPGWFGG
jgi:DNA-binding MarR family transcriptional regulator